MAIQEGCLSLVKDAGKFSAWEPGLHLQGDFNDDDTSQSARLIIRVVDPDMHELTSSCEVTVFYQHDKEDDIFLHTGLRLSNRGFDGRILVKTPCNDDLII